MLKKKNSTWGISELCTTSIDHIKKDILNFSFEWTIDTSRQAKYSTHQNTEMYPIRFLDYTWNVGDTVNIIDRYNLNSVQARAELEDIYNKLESEFDGKVVRVEVVKLKANTNIRTHVDGGTMLAVARRCHIPIITNKDVFFTVYKDTVNMKEGVIYEINNSMPHSVLNDSDHDRIHIIIDVLPNEYFL